MSSLGHYNDSLLTTAGAQQFYHSSNNNNIAKFKIHESSLFHFQQWKKFIDHCCIVVDDDDLEVCHLLIDNINNFAGYDTSIHSFQTELGLTGFIDTAISIILVAINKQGKRNATTATSGRSRPDFSIHILTGEDKIESNYSKGVSGKDPVLDLVEKTPWNEW